MTILLLAEHDNAALAPATAKALTAARALGEDVDILVAGSGCRAVAEAAAKLEEVAQLVLALMDSHSAFLAPATAMGKNIAPRVAALLDVMQISDIIKVLSPTTFERPIYAGNAIQTVESTDAKKVITVRTTAFAAAASGGAAAIEAVAVPAPLKLSAFERAEIQKSDRPEL